MSIPAIPSLLQPNPLLHSHWILAAEGSSFGVPRGSFRQIGQRACLFFAASPLLSFVHWDVNEGNPEAATSEFTDPNSDKCFQEKRTANVTCFPSRVSICIWKIGSHLACWPISHDMGNNGRAWQCRMARSLVDIPLSPHNCPCIVERGDTILALDGFSI